jgi:hypothetical protein
VNRGRKRALYDTAHVSPTVRVSFFVVGLVALAAVYAATGSSALQVLVLLALTWGLLPALLRRFGTERPELARLRDRNPPAAVIVRSLVVAVAWGAVTFLLLAPVIGGLGPWFWWWVVMWPWLEVSGFLTRRELARKPEQEWRARRPARDSAVAGAAVAPFIAGLTLLDGDGVGTAVAGGVASGAIVFAISFAAERSRRRSG